MVTFAVTALLYGMLMNLLSLLPHMDRARIHHLDTLRLNAFLKCTLRRGVACVMEDPASFDLMDRTS